MAECSHDDNILSGPVLSSVASWLVHAIKTSIWKKKVTKSDISAFSLSLFLACRYAAPSGVMECIRVFPRKAYVVDRHCTVLLLLSMLLKMLPDLNFFTFDTHIQDHQGF